MTQQQDKPGLIKRFAPWLLAIIVGIGVGWLIGGLFAPASDEADVAQSDTRPAPPPVTPKNQAARPPAPDVAGPPITLAISRATTSNFACQWGPDFDTYYQQARAMQQQADRDSNGAPPQVVLRVPNRPWQGIPVGGVAVMPYGQAIIFDASFADVRAAMTRNGVSVPPNGVIRQIAGRGGPLEIALRRVSGRTARYGQTLLYCGMVRGSL